ncbi:outer membrane protein [Helicobacter cetorum]|uniref:Outer membrane protein n=1 Tax=Helicobacter cetorum (strain ATCC BAA-429 / MIT 00-7128) TaxID=182217 RepID=I0ELB0_HELC0|nr:outer membrane protein [Helicobacter cetorum]AFI03729.1 outer membrane protein [Helicobacter cetorum MIT 00-7128]
MKVKFLGALALSLSLSGLYAEESSLFAGVGYELGLGLNQMTAHYPICGSNGDKWCTKSMTTAQPLMNGVNLSAGYHQFVGKSKRFGIKYYGFFSYSASSNAQNQGGVSGGLDLPQGAYGATAPNALALYGAGMNFIYNVKETQDAKFGFYTGFALAGQTWSFGSIDKSRDIVSKKDIKDTLATMNASYVQFLFDFGMRLKYKKHAIVELGFKVPTINLPYYKTPKMSYDQTTGEWVKDKSWTKLETRRAIAFYINFLYAF